MKTYPELTGPERAPASGGKPLSLVILLHGYGSDGNDLFGLTPMLAPHLPNTQFVSPNAPFPCEMSPAGHQWYSLRDWSSASLLKGAEEAAPYLDQFVDAQLAKHNLTEDRIAWVGFSQGTMMSLHVALKRAKACAGVVGFSGALVAREINAKPPVLLIHGNEDPVVPFAALAHAEAGLKENGVPVTTLHRPHLGHSIDVEGLDAAAAFLKAKLA